MRNHDSLQDVVDQYNNFHAKDPRTLGVHRSTVKRAITRGGGPRYKRTTPYTSILDPFKTEIGQMISEPNRHASLCQGV